MTSLRSQIEAHIRTSDRAGDRLLREVAGAANIDAVLKGAVSTPSVYVLKGRDKLSDNGRTITQVDGFLILIAVSNVADGRGSDSSDAVEALSRQVETWLKSFKPDLAAWVDAGPRFGEIKRDRGQVQAWNNQVLVWADHYKLEHYRRCC